MVMLKLSHAEPQARSLVEAVQRGDVATLRQRLVSDPALARARIIDEKGVGRTLLHVAADWPGHFPNGAETVRILALAGADVDAPLSHTPEEIGCGPLAPPETPLHWAASSDDVAVLDALLDAGADIEAPGAIFTGGSPMSDAVVFAQWNAARRLLERGAKTTLWQASALGLVERVREHLGHGDASTADVTNALWHACRGGQLAAAELLVDRGGDLRWIGHDGKTPLDVARESSSPELIAWLDART